MAKIVFSAYAVRYPTGGMMSGNLQYALGMVGLGHDVTFVERAGWEGSCWNPSARVMSDDCTYGVAVAGAFLERIGLDRWCYVDAHGGEHGPAAGSLDEVFARADAFIDFGCPGEWIEEMASVPMSVYIEGEPGHRHIAMELDRRRGIEPPPYDRFVTNGCNIGTPASTAPTAGLRWEHVMSPVKTAIHRGAPLPVGTSFSTVMNWKAHEPVEFDGATYGQKDMEFPGFETLPALVPDARFEMAVSGGQDHRERLEALGWGQQRAHDVTLSYDSYLAYIDASLGEFSVAKNAFVALRTGWFSERSAAYLARGRPAVLQDTGFSDHLPVGEGLFAVNTVDEAAAAIEEVLSDPGRHQKAAREIAMEHLEGTKVMGDLLDRLGLS